MTEFQSKKEPGGPTNGMLHRSPDINCPLCQLWGIPWDEDDPETWGKQHIFAEELWVEWNPKDKQGKWIGEIIKKAALFDPPISIDEKTVKDHFGRKHRIEQPMLSKKLSHEEALFETSELSEESREIIEHVFRQKCLTTNQITEVFFKPKKPVGKTAQNTAARVLNTLASNWNLYRYMPSQSDSERRNALSNMNKTAVWFLGKMSVPYIQDTYGIDQRFYPHYLNRARDVDANNLTHDLRAAEVFVSIIRELNGLDQGEESADGKKIISKIAGDIEVWAKVENWYGPGMNLLPLGYLDPKSGESHRILPDGFAAISIVGSDNGMPDSQLPFFIEYDNDSKTVGEVADQLLAYHLMGIAGASKKRFPEFNVDGYIPATLMVFSRKNRVKVVAKKFQEKAKELGIDSGAPLLLVAEEDWRRGPLTEPGVISAWDEEFKEDLFVDSLIASSYKLIKSGATDPDMVFVLDSKAAPAKPEKKKNKEDKDEYFKNLDFEPAKESEEKKDLLKGGDDPENNQPKTNKEEPPSHWSDFIEDDSEKEIANEEIPLPQPEDDIKDLDSLNNPVEESNLNTEESEEEIEYKKDKEEVELPDLNQDHSREDVSENVDEEKENSSDIQESDHNNIDSSNTPPLPGEEPVDVTFKEEIKEDKSPSLDIESAVKTFAGETPIDDLEPDLPKIDPDREVHLEDTIEQNQEEDALIQKEPLSQGPIVSRNDLPDPSKLDSLDETPEYEKNTFLDTSGSSADFPSLEEKVTGLNPEPVPITSPRPDIPSPVSVGSFDKNDPLAPNSLVNFPGAPVYNPSLNLQDPENIQEEVDLSSLPEDSPIRKEVASNNLLEKKEPFVAGGPIKTQSPEPNEFVEDVAKTIPDIPPATEPTPPPATEPTPPPVTEPIPPPVTEPAPPPPVQTPIQSEGGVPGGEQSYETEEDFQTKLDQQAARRRARRKRRAKEDS